jgi:hypothetical protein
MGDSSYRLNFDQGKKNDIQHVYCPSIEIILIWITLALIISTVLHF